ncbi:PREDICTED: uncharacterized protein LOC109474919 [Branchiostoma belcheri]|uniref:Uncharacterized protein LOC109474919 n=1 Tax=Branchiostoma belcheri TaxID=7741 RepID=A0A6P4ZMX1_BRABE|nr:PREDICTED: uncharacterized protein LOC109474919 [Branchiostoma belcheri]
MILDLSAAVFADLPTSPMPIICLYIIVIIIPIILVNVKLGRADQISQNIPTETIKNITTTQGDGNITVNTGSRSTVNITYFHDVSEEHTHHKPSQTSEPHHVQLEESRALVPVDRLSVPKPVGRPQRQNKNCSHYIEFATEMSAEGKTPECIRIIDELMKIKTDPDSQVSLRQAASLVAIYQGDFEKASRLLCGAEVFLSEEVPVHEGEHILWGSHLTALAQLRAGDLEGGIVLAEDALEIAQSDTVASGCITAYPLLNHAWFVTEIAAGQDNDDIRCRLLKRAEKEYQHAIEHAKCEHPKHMLHSKSRVPLFAKIGLALLYLGCRVSVDNFRLGVSIISLDDMKKAKSVIDALDKEESLCNSAKCRLMMVKTFFQYRLGTYQQAYDLAQEAKAFATEHSLGRYAKFAEGIAKYLKKYV